MRRTMDKFDKAVLLAVFIVGAIVGGTVMSALHEQPINHSAYDEAAATCIELGGVPIQGYLSYGENEPRLEKCQFPRKER